MSGHARAGSTLPSSLTSLPGASSAGPLATGSIRNWRCWPYAGAVAVRCPSAGLIHHADRGSQYCSIEYQAELRKNGISISMSGKGNCFHNAMVETFFKILKAELVCAPSSRAGSKPRSQSALHRRLLQSRPPPFGARLHQPTSVRRAGSVKSKTLSTNAGQVQACGGVPSSDCIPCSPCPTW